VYSSIYFCYSHIATWGITLSGELPKLCLNKGNKLCQSFSYHGIQVACINIPCFDTLFHTDCIVCSPANFGKKTILPLQVGRRIKQVPLAFYKTVPSTLFHEKTAQNDDPALDFAGWSFTPSATKAI
jgi:hypothetical protein